MYTCANCTVRTCQSGEKDKNPKNCPGNETKLIEKAMALYKEPVNFRLSHESALVEAEGYCKNTRLEEIMDFANKCGFKKLGIAFCVGLSREAKVLVSVLNHNGFETEAVICKNGSIPKEFIGIKDEEKVRPGTYESMCNPIGQALILNEAKTDLNLILGLCVGHDSLFIKYSEAPITVFAVKDRVLAHNPLGAIYLAEGYYKKKLYK